MRSYDIFRKGIWSYCVIYRKRRVFVLHSWTSFARGSRIKTLMIHTTKRFFLILGRYIKSGNGTRKVLNTPFIAKKKSCLSQQSQSRQFSLLTFTGTGVPQAQFPVVAPSLFSLFVSCFSSVPLPALSHFARASEINIDERGLLFWRLNSEKGEWRFWNHWRRNDGTNERKREKVFCFVCSLKS